MKTTTTSEIRRDIAALLGLALIITGFGLIWLPLALIGAGMLVLVLLYAPPARHEAGE